MTPQERKDIIERPWTFEEAREASKHLRKLETKGYWDVLDLPEWLVEFAQAWLFTPSLDTCHHVIPQAKTKIIEAYEAHMGLSNAPKDDSYEIKVHDPLGRNVMPPIHYEGSLKGAKRRASRAAGGHEITLFRSGKVVAHRIGDRKWVNL